MKSFKELLVWKREMDLLKLMHPLTKGVGRWSTTSFMLFMSIEIGSLFEMHTQILIAREFKYSGEDKLLDVENRSTELSKMTIKLIRVLEARAMDQRFLASNP